MDGRERGDTVAVQEREAGSHLRRTRQLLALRRDRPELRGSTEVRWLTDDGPLVAYRRGGTVVVANCGEEPVAFDLPVGERRVVFRSDAGANTDPRPCTGGLVIEPDTAVVLGSPAPPD